MRLELCAHYFNSTYICVCTHCCESNNPEQSMDKYYVTCTWMSSEFKNYSSKQRYLDVILVFVIFVNIFSQRRFDKL